MQDDILTAIGKQVRGRGEEPAVSGRQTLSYAELDGLSAGVAAAIQSAVGKESGHVVVLSSEPEPFIYGLLGVLRSGYTYVPALPDLPAARLEFVRRTVNPVAVLHDARNSSLAALRFPGIPLVSLENQQEAAGWPDLSPDHPAYVFFSSGSTGEPKGIVGRYASLGQFIGWEASFLALEGPVNVSQLISPMFDAYLRDVLLPLSLGGCCCVPDKTVREDASRLAAWISDTGVEVMHAVPSLFRTLFEAGSDMVPDFATVRHVLLSGEELLPMDVALWSRRLGENTALYNLYGATETTMTKFAHRVTREDLKAARVPIGLPIAGATAWIADGELKPVPDGEAGEIIVETEFGTLGYLGDPDATRHVFVPVSGANTGVAYRTGDIGRKRTDGLFEFLGRNDRQVKIRGVRVEPGEVEVAARSQPGVLDCVVDVELHADGMAAMVLYAVLTQGLDAATVRSHLQSQLPAPYMPSSVRACQQIPRLLSGKVDFQSLRSTSKASRRPADPPANVTEIFVLELFRQLVRDEEIGVEDDFFDVGGHSLLAIQVVSRIREHNAVEVPLGVLFENPTARGLAKYIVGRPTPSPAPVDKPRAVDRIELGAMNDQELDRLLADLTGQG